MAKLLFEGWIEPDYDVVRNFDYLGRSNLIRLIEG